MTSPGPRRRRRPARPRRTVASGATATTTAITPGSVLASLPPGLRDPLLAELNGIVNNYRLGKWEPSELKVGKLCEIVYAIVKGMVDGSYPTKLPKKPGNMEAACRALSSATTFPRTVRLTMPRVVVALYEIRNDRGVGHSGGDVDPNHMDATMVVAGAKWLVAELVRLLHSVDTATATQVVDAMVERIVPGIWTSGKVRRVLATGLTMKQQTLLLAYGQPIAVPETDLFAWIEAPKLSDYRKDVLVSLHRDRLIEYDREAGTVVVLPPGDALVENTLSDHL
jgi:hypothetical protein